MTFNPERVADFLKLFEQSKLGIRSMKGCKRLELLKDRSTENIFMTYSFWNSEKDLENYKSSKLFEDVWSKTKTYFSEKPQAWSLEQLSVNE